LRRVDLRLALGGGFGFATFLRFYRFLSNLQLHIAFVLNCDFLCARIDALLRTERVARDTGRPGPAVSEDDKDEQDS